MNRYVYYVLFCISYCSADSFENLSSIESPILKYHDKLKILTKDYQDTLYWNDKKVETPSDGCELMSINGVVRISNYKTYLLSCFYGGTIDNDTNNHLLFVNISPKGNISVSGILPEGTYSINDSAIFVKYHNDAPYSDNDDYGIYAYNPINNNTELLYKPKPDSFYLQKYKNYKVAKIIDKMKADDCYELDDNGKLFFSHACNYGETYCFMFSAIKTPVKDNDYYLLKNSCNG